MLVHSYSHHSLVTAPASLAYRSEARSMPMSEASRLIAVETLHQSLLDPVQSAMIHDHLVAIHSSGRRSRVLDLGAGSGVWAIALANSERYSDVLAIETDWSSLTPEHTSLHGNIDFDTILDLDTFPIQDLNSGTFDLIHIKGVLLRTRDYPALVARVAQLLRPGGKLVLVENEIDYHSAVGAIPRCLRTWQLAAKEAYESVGVDTTMATRLVPCLEASELFDRHVWIQELGIPCGPYMESNSKTLATAGNIHASLIGSTLARMQPILERHGYQRAELLALRDECVQVLCDPDARFFQRLFSVCGTRSI